MKFFLLMAVCLTLQTLAFAQAQTAPEDALCVNDKDGKKGAKAQTINKMIDAANDPLAAAYRSYSAALCAEALAGPPTLKQFLRVADLYKEIDSSNSEVLPTFIRKQCIEASLQRSIDQDGYSCEGGKKKKFENTGTKDKNGKVIDTSVIPCINQNSVDYIHYALNTAIKCFASIREPIDPRFLLKKINTETGFNFFLAYGGGVGLGQSTSDPINEIAGKGEGYGNARKILEDLRDSEDPSCLPFKSVVKKDLQKTPPTPPMTDVCKYVDANDGVARSLVMGLGYYVYNRDKVITPYLEKNLGAAAAQNKDLINYATFLSYGPKGPNGAKSYLDRKGFSNNKKLTAAQGIKKIQSAEYISSAEDRYKNELLPNLKLDNKGLTKEEIERGNSCVGR